MYLDQTLLQGMARTQTIGNNEVYAYTVEPPNKGHFGSNINLAVMSFI